MALSAHVDLKSPLVAGSRGVGGMVERVDVGRWSLTD
jgi:hypothetical protein